MIVGLAVFAWIAFSAIVAIGAIGRWEDAPLSTRVAGVFLMATLWPVLLLAAVAQRLGSWIEANF